MYNSAYKKVLRANRRKNIFWNIVGLFSIVIGSTILLFLVYAILVALFSL